MFTVNIKNLGKLADATIRIGGLTVFAGPNNTGKSFVSKALYSVFGAMNENHLAAAVYRRLAPLSKAVGGNFFRMEVREEAESATPLGDLRDAVKNLGHVADSVTMNDYTDEGRAIEEAMPSLHESLDKINAAMRALPRGTQSPAEQYGEGIDDGQLENIHSTARDLMEMRQWKPADFVRSGLQEEIRHHLLQNFQTSRLSFLAGDTRDKIELEIGGGVNVAIEKEEIQFHMPAGGLHLLQQYSRVLYLESPGLWKLRWPLENVGKMRAFRRARISGVPEYFYDMSSALRGYPTDDPDFPDVFAKLTKVLGGKLVVNEMDDDLLFRDSKGRQYPLRLAAMSISNLGMLGLLIEKNLLDRNTFLFIDEPEAHLHPEWQVEMAEALFALAKGGVNVVLATHSVDIMKWIEVQVKENPDSAKIIALNHFSTDGVNPDEGDFNKRLDDIEEELSAPFCQLYYEGL